MTETYPRTPQAPVNGGSAPTSSVVAAPTPEKPEKAKRRRNPEFRALIKPALARSLERFGKIYSKEPHQVGIDWMVEKALALDPHYRMEVGLPPEQANG